jgi:hypothetical protein
LTETLGYKDKIKTRPSPPKVIRIYINKFDESVKQEPEIALECASRGWRNRWLNVIAMLEQDPGDAGV